MNRKTLNFGLDACLFVLFAVTVVTMFGGGVMSLVHDVAGTLLLLGSALHLLLHREWIQRFVFHPRRPASESVRLNRRVDLWLVLVSLLCGLSGLVAWLVPLGSSSSRVWGALHRVSGFATLGVTVVHLRCHRQVIRRAVRRALGVDGRREQPGQSRA